jgi:hypothetical protein
MNIDEVLNSQQPEPELGRGATVQDEYVKEYMPSRTECLRNHNINIEFLSMGCVVRVGCMSIPFTFVNDAMDAITEYVKNPYYERKKWEKLIEEKQ